MLGFLYETAPRSRSGLIAIDFSTCYALLTEADRRLVPLQVPRGMAQTDVVAALFKTFSELYQVFARALGDQALRAQEAIN